VNFECMCAQVADDDDDDDFKFLWFERQYEIFAMESPGNWGGKMRVKQQSVNS